MAQSQSKNIQFIAQQNLAAKIRHWSYQSSDDWEINIQTEYSKKIRRSEDREQKIRTSGKSPTSQNA